MMKASIVFLTTVLLTVITLGGCSTSEQTKVPSNGPSAKASSSKLDACSLLTKSDAESLTGESAGPPSTSQVGDTVSRCGYVSASGSKHVSLLARRASSTGEAIQIFKKAQAESKGLSGSDPREIAGLGDAAYWAGGNLKQLNVTKGDVWLIVSANVGGGDPLTASEAAAKKILARM